VFNLPGYKRCKSKEHLDFISLQSEWSESRVKTTKTAGKDVQNRNHYTLLVGMQISTTIWKTVWRFFKKLEV
jgi:hypothetical protein